MLGAILCVTSTTGNLERAIAAYTGALAYRVVERGFLAPSQAGAWGASHASARPFCVLAPSDGEIVHLRLIEKPDAVYIPAHSTLGWNVTEFNVGGVADLNRQLKGGPFLHVAGPEPLSMNPDITAMQAIGPDGELVYFTQIDPSPRTGHLPHRLAGVGRVFIMVLGVADLAVAAAEFQTHFGMEMTAPITFSSELIAAPLGLPLDQNFRMGLVRLPGRFSLEIDELGAHAPQRARPLGDLPGGISIVSFAVESLAKIAGDQPIYAAGAPFDGAKACLIQGPGGALFELIEQ